MAPVEFKQWNSLERIKGVWKKLKETPSPFSDELPVTKILPSQPAAPKSKKELLIELREQREKQDEANVREITLIFSTIALGAKLASIDGEVNKKEIQSFKSVFPKTNHPQIEVGKFFGNAANDDVGYEHYARRVTSYFPNDKAICKDLLLSLFEFGAVDGPLNVEEINFLKKVNDIFGLGDEYFFSTVKNKIIPKSRNPYTILGITEKTPADEMKRAYRLAAQSYHPDRLATLECHAEIIKIANERFRSVQNAYDKIKSIHKIK